MGSLDASLEVGSEAKVLLEVGRMRGWGIGLCEGARGDVEEAGRSGIAEEVAAGLGELVRGVAVDKAGSEMKPDSLRDEAEVVEGFDIEGDEDGSVVVGTVVSHPVSPRNEHIQERKGSPPEASMVHWLEERNGSA